MRSDRRFDYDEVQRWFDGDGGFPDEQSAAAISDFARIAAAIEKRRLARGGLEFETVEAKVVLDDEGHPVDVRVRTRTQATGMIEEAMILANEVVARHMAAASAPMVYRIHEEPDPEALDRIALILKEFDYPIQEIRGASPQKFLKIIEYAHGRPEKLLINSLLLRAMERARYVDFLEPHFGLASTAYTHFTSPIRRYPDLIVHRLLKAQLAGTLQSDGLVSAMADELGWLAEHCSYAEREAEMAEGDSVRIKLCELMSDRLGEVFTGIITGVQPFGLFVQLENTAEGLVHVESMADDWYRLDADRHMLVGESTGRSYRLGMPVRVRILNVIVSETRIDMELA
jgi:ribonuclease R